MSNRFAQVISPFVPDKRVLLRTGCLTIVDSEDDDNGLDQETIQLMLQAKVQECADLAAVLEKVAEDAGHVSNSISAYLTDG